MEYLEEIPLKRDKESRREFKYVEKIEKDLQNYQLQKENIRIEDSSENSEEVKSQNVKRNNIDNKINIKNNKKYNMINTQIFKNTKLYTKEKIEKDDSNKGYSKENLEYLLSLCKYDIFSFARHGHYKELEKLFLEGISPDSKDKYGNTLLIISAQNNNKRILKICLRYGAQINMQNLMGNTALHFAKEYGYDEIFEYLIRKGADPDIKNLRGIPAKYGLYSIDDKELFLGKGLKYSKNKNNIMESKYKKYEDNIINDIK